MTTFHDLGIHPSLLEAIERLNFVTPTPIQEKVIPILMKSPTDVVALAQTGTGKTAAFGLPMLSLLNTKNPNIQGLILCPTRELCMQITKDLNNFAACMQNVHITAVYGGASIQNQLSDIKRGVQIIVATPGRMVDIIERKRINLSSISFVVLDEADEMLNMGFKEDLDTILSETPDTKNTWLFSATMPNEVLSISRNYMNKPIEVTMGQKNQANENIDHVYYTVAVRDKYAAVKRIADVNPDIYAIVFCRTRIETQQVADNLIKDGYSADALHGDLSQSQRDMVMKRFRSKTLQMLVATDVAARGIDVNDVTHIINYNLPDELESYTHRSGRTARAGKKGISIALIGKSEEWKIKSVEKIIRKQFKKATIPTAKEVYEQQLINFANRITQTEVNEKVLTLMPAIQEHLQDLTKEDILQRLISLEFNKFDEYYKNTKDLNDDSYGGGGSSSNTSRIFINMGKKDGLSKDEMPQFIEEAAQLMKGDVVFVDAKDSYSFIEVKKEAVKKLIRNLDKKQYNNRTIHLDANSRPPSNSRGRDSRNGDSREEGRSSQRFGSGGSRRPSSKPRFSEPLDKRKRRTTMK